MITRTLWNSGDLQRWIAVLEGRRFPITVTVAEGKKRTNEQNRLQRLWCLEVADQLGDMTAEEVRGYSKLHFGVPMLRAENEPFCAEYDSIIRPLPYEHKLRLMQEPFDFGVTRLMTSKQKHRYLNLMLDHWTKQGCALTIPRKEE